jgi:AraC-like DNA-binding protein
MEIQDENKLEIVDFSQFKWRAFISGETIVEDFSVMKFSGRIEDIVPEHYFPATYTLQVITAGTCKVNINNKVYELSANSGYFTSPDFLLKRPEPSATTVEMYILSYSPKMAETLCSPFSLSQLARVYMHPTWQMSEKKTQQMAHYMELIREVVDDKNRKAALYLLNSLIFCLSDYYHDEPTQTQLPRSEEITGQFLVLVDGNCHQHHSLDWYASKMCLTTRYVANTVKQTLGFTASSCIERALMQRAKVMLSTSATPIQQIADRLGFQNQSHFGTFFKRHEGCSPKDFRMHNHKLM